MLRLTSVPGTLANLIASMLVMRMDTDVARLAVDRLVDIARQDVTKVGIFSLNRNQLNKLKPLPLHCMSHSLKIVICV